MNIALNIAGVSYNDGTRGGRYRNYETALDSMYEFVINPLRAEGHTLTTHLCTYPSEKSAKLQRDYDATTYTELWSEDIPYNQLGGGDRVDGRWKAISKTFYDSLTAIESLSNYDVVISTRFDIKFHQNPFKVYQFDWTKCNFLWRESEYVHLPIVNDTFIVFPHHMIAHMKQAIHIMETNPPNGVSIGMHNLYLSLAQVISPNEIQWVCDEFVTSIDNILYTLTRHD